MDLAAMMGLVIEHVGDEQPARPRQVALGGAGDDLGRFRAARAD